jgi:hypothetical protein
MKQNQQEERGGPAMPNLTLEERVAALEKQMGDLRSATINRFQKDGWLRTVGMFSGDEVAKRVDAAILKAREAEREKARRRATARKKTARPRKS